MSIWRFPLKQHVGKEAIPCVAEGSHVLRGQLLANACPNALSVPIYSSICGVVTRVTSSEIEITADNRENTLPKSSPSGNLASADMNPADANQNPADTNSANVNSTHTVLADYLPLAEDDPLEMIRQAGIVGLGGAGFPTYAKLRSFPKNGILIANAAECEPILEHNMVRIQTSASEIIQGLCIVSSRVHATRCIIAIKEKHTLECEALRRAIGENPIELALLPDLYPMGEERAVVREALGTLLPPDALPSAANAVVINVETVYRIYEAVVQKKPLIDKDITIAGKIYGNHQKDLIQVFLDQPIGIPTQTLLEQAGGLAKSYGELIAGGPFTGKRTTLDAPLLKTTGGIIAAECFPKGPEKIGLLVCACGADEQRLRQIADSMGSTVVGVAYCKQAKEVRGVRKCENPGHCPGQVQKILELKKAGAQAVLISNCTDCSNTVMSCAPQLGLPVYHCTDQALRAVNLPLIRRIHYRFH